MTSSAISDDTGAGASANDPQEDKATLPIASDNQGTTPAEDLPVPVPGLEVDFADNVSSEVGDLESIFSTVSFRSGAFEYVEENGRRYHKYKQGQYLLPNDQTEQERLNIQHQLMLFNLDGKLNVAPIQRISGSIDNVLDIGTGTGNWAIDFANAYPSATVLGIDLSPIQPEHIPKNCRFQIKDAEDEWMFSTPFDYVHGRALITCFKSHRVVFTHAFASLRSGGYLELQDGDMPMRFLDSSGNGSALQAWSQRFMASAAALGKDFTRARNYKAILEEIGFVDVVENRMPLPIGTWAAGKKMKALGELVRADLLVGLEGISMAIMTRGLGVTVDEVKANLVDVRAELLSNHVHAYFTALFVYGRKP